MVSTRESGNPPLGIDIDSADESSLSPRDGSLLRTVQEEGLTVFSFDGLKRLSGLHQETLSRALDRLEDEGFVERVAEGYRVTERGGELVPQPLGSIQSRIPIIQSLLPPDMSVDRVVSVLKGRWFGSLRWLGYSLNDEGLVLKWITEDDGIQVDAKFTDAYLSIEAKVAEGKDVSHAVKASHQLLGQISRVYNEPRRARGLVSPVAFFPDMGFPGVSFA